MLKSISYFSLFLKYFWVNLFYILPATFVFCLPNFFTSLHRFVIDSFLPFFLGNFFSLIWEILRYYRQEKRTGEGSWEPSPSAFWNNLYYIFPICLMNASIAVFEICLLSSEEWQAGRVQENLLYLILLFFLFLAVNWTLATFFSWLMRSFASVIWRLCHRKRKEDFYFEEMPSENFIFGGFPAASVTKNLYAISHPKGLFGKIFWYWLHLNLLFFVPAAIGIGLGWLPLAPELVKSRYFLPLEMILWLYINLLALGGAVIWFLVKILLEENAGQSLARFTSKKTGDFLYWLLKANLIAIMPILSLAILGKYLPASLAFLDPAHQSIRTLPPSLWQDFLFGNILLIPFGFYGIWQKHKAKKI
ncbi:hypothetical protein FAI41_03555 [Acetobacteraceae bacterium]|nr:hypothetical protein FAI41_03555 [Acetobacteraceae bacterium]